MPYTAGLATGVGPQSSSNTPSAAAAEETEATVQAEAETTEHREGLKQQTLRITYRRPPSIVAERARSLTIFSMSLNAEVVVQNHGGTKQIHTIWKKSSTT